MLPNSFLSQVLQVCAITPNMDEVLNESLTAGELALSESITLNPNQAGSKDTHCTMHFALAWVDNLMWKLVQPLEGASIYKEFFGTRSEGIRHVAFATGNFSFAESVEKVTS